MGRRKNRPGSDISGFGFQISDFGRENGADLRRLPREEIQKRIRLEARASQAGRGVGAITGKEHADVHLVGLALEPFEIAFDAVPRAGQVWASSIP